MRKVDEQKIIELLSKLLKPKAPAADFERRLSVKLQSEFQKVQQEKEKVIGLDMEKIQRIIGMAVTNESFRKSLFQDAAGACRNAGFNLSELELAALKNLKEDAVIEFADELDERISKKSVFPDM